MLFRVRLRRCTTEISGASAILFYFTFFLKKKKIYSDTIGKFDVGSESLVLCRVRRRANGRVLLQLNLFNELNSSLKK